MPKNGDSVKVIRIIARLNIGGPAIHTVLLTSELKSRGYDDTLVCGCIEGSEGDMSYLAEEKGISPIVVTEMSREISVLKDLKSFLRLLLIMKREKPDIVHTHTAKAGTLGRLAAVCAGVPVRIHTFHGHVLDGYFSPFKARAFLWVERFLALFTDRVITVSESVKDEIVNKFKVMRGSKCAVISLGFDLEKFLGCEINIGKFRKKLGLDEDTLLVGIIGRLVPIKNHVMFLDAARQVIGSGFKGRVKFIIVGDGEYRAYLQEYARKLHLEDVVIFTGWEQGLDSVYADLDIVALTSLNEGTPVSLIEAMAAGKPVVATDVGGVRDLVRNGENGFLVESKNAEYFSCKLLKLMDDKKLCIELGRRGREFVRSRYSKERLVDDIEKLYKECLKGKTRKV